MFHFCTLRFLLTCSYSSYHLMLDEIICYLHAGFINSIMPVAFVGYQYRFLYETSPAHCSDISIQLHHANQPSYPLQCVSCYC